MLSWIKYVVVSIAVIGLVVFSGYMTTQHTANTRTVAEVEGAIKTALLGESRGLGLESGISKEEFVSTVIASVVETQKNHGKTVKVDYVFLDSSGAATEVDESVKSIQYVIEILGEDGKVQSKAEKHLAIDLVPGLGSGGDVAVGVKTETIEFALGDKERSKTVILPSAGNIESVTVDNGNVHYVKSGNSVTVTVNNGVENKTLTGGGVVNEHTKYIDNHPIALYSKDGYSGLLKKYGAGGNDEPELSKYVVNQPTSIYTDVEGYKGILKRYVASGEYRPAETKSVTNQTGSYYNVGGFVGTLSRYVHSSQNVPAHTKTVTETITSDSYPASEISYNKDGYVGTCYGQGVETVSTGVSGKWVTKYDRSCVSYEDVVIPGYWKQTNHQCWWGGEPHNSAYYCGYQDQVWVPERVEHHCRDYEYINPREVWVEGETFEYRQTYSGQVTRPEKSETVYRYKGNVTKPEVDTRRYAYMGEVKKAGTVGSEDKYRGYVTKPREDTRTYETGYKYTVKIKYK